jgi:hypothetical protein
MFGGARCWEHNPYPYYDTRPHVLQPDTSDTAPPSGFDTVPDSSAVTRTSPPAKPLRRTKRTGHRRADAKQIETFSNSKIEP